MLKGRQKELWEKAEAERERCRQWLLVRMRPGQPKPATKLVLRDIAMRELGVSKSSFDAAWIVAIEMPTARTGMNRSAAGRVRGSSPLPYGRALVTEEGHELAELAAGAIACERMWVDCDTKFN